MKILILNFIEVISLHSSITFFMDDIATFTNV